MTKGPSFHERIELLENALKCLDDVTQTISDEIERMAAAEKRFSERRSEKTQRRAR